MTTTPSSIARIRSERGTGEAQQIEICRVICIFLMMYVHVPPGIGVEHSAMETSWIAPIGLFVGDVLSRASVAALSFISGYLLWSYNRDKAFLELIASKLRTLILPMTIWGAIFLLLAFVKANITGEPYKYAAISDPIGLINDIIGLTQPTANLPLFFIRDLFVSLLLIRLVAPFLRGPTGLAVLAVVLLVNLFGDPAPLVIRANILLFATAGAVWAANSLRLSDAARPAVAIPVVVMAGVGAWLLYGGPEGQAAGAHGNGLERLSLTFAVIFVAHLLLSTAVGQHLAALGKHMFLTYLMHMPLLAIFWFLWQRLVGGSMDVSYILFFFGCPIVAMGLGILFGQLADHLPAWMQTGLRGKVRQRSVGPRPQRPLA